MTNTLKRPLIKMAVHLYIFHLAGLASKTPSNILSTLSVNKSNLIMQMMALGMKAFLKDAIL